MQHHSLQTLKTAHVYSLGGISENTRSCWICCHGYGQAASSFIHKFSHLADDRTLFLAPEGLSRFYFGGFDGKIGASWMTKADRETEIRDYCNWIGMVYQHFIPVLNSRVQINLLGFSQGVATISRFIYYKKPIFDNLICWSGSLAHDIPYLELREYLLDKNLYYLYGNRDPFIKPENIEQLKKQIRHHKLDFDIREFDGEHKIDRQVLASLAGEIHV